MNFVKFFFLSFVFMVEPIYSQTKIELFDLIKTYAIAGQHNDDGWTAGTEDNSPISWKTNGIDNVDSPQNHTPNGHKDFNSDLGAFYRVGSVIVTLNNKPLYVLEKKKKASSWEIKLYGPRTGISAIVLSNDLIDPDNIFNPELVTNYFKKKGCEIALVRCDKGNKLSEGTRLYKLTMKNKKKIYLFLDFSSGSAGYSGSMILLLSEPNEAFCLKRNLKGQNCK